MTDILTEEEIKNLSPSWYWGYEDTEKVLNTLRALNAQVNGLREALEIISQTVHEHAEGPCNCRESDNCITEWCDSAVAKQALSRSPEDWREEGRLKEEVLRAARPFLNDAEAIFDWMNGVDLSADHAEADPETYASIQNTLPAFRKALEAWEGGK